MYLAFRDHFASSTLPPVAMHWAATGTEAGWLEAGVGIAGEGGSDDGDMHDI